MSNLSGRDASNGSLAGIAMAYGGERGADGPSFKIAREEMFGLLVAYGVGKTTSFNLIARSIIRIVRMVAVGHRCCSARSGFNAAAG